MRTSTLVRWVVSIAVLASLVTGCVFLKVREQHKRMDAGSRIWGTVTTEEPSSSPLVVVLLRRDGETVEIFDHYVLEKPGHWYFGITPGTYALAAFEDVNADLTYQPDEPALAAGEGPTLELASGESKRGIELVIPADGRADVNGPVDIAAVQARTIHDQLRTSIGLLTVEGEVVDLADPRFDAKNGKKGLWAPFDFIFDVGAGIYFLEKYDPDKIPVLFVHGIGGNPRNFEYLSANLDRDHFQPWFYYYPSGAYLDAVSDHLSKLVVKLRVRHGFDKLFVIAHSMGGLVCRSFIQKHHADTQRDYVALFVSISTPWSGHAAAELGVKHAPAVVRSWENVAPDSDFLNAIFFEDPDTRRVTRALPGHVPYFLFFSYERNKFRRGAADDKVVTLASQLRPQAQQEARKVYGFDSDHRSILHSPETSAVLNGILAEAME